jgi:ankyrin repeat protein
MKKGVFRFILDRFAGSGSNTNAVGELLQAVCKFDHALVEGMLTSRGYPNGYDENGETPLDYAAMGNATDPEGSRKMLRLLLKKGARVNQKNASGATALYSSIGEPDLTSILLAHGADVHNRDNDGRTALHAKVPSWCRARTPDHAERCRKDFLMLLQAGADLNVRDNKGQSPLGTALHYQGLYEAGNADLYENSSRVIQTLRKLGARE